MYTEDEYGRRIPNISVDENYEVTAENIMGEIRNFFNSKLNRPEILNRFGDNFVVFDFIRPDTDKLILLKSLATIRENLKKQKNYDFIFDDDFVESFRKYYIVNNLVNGGRGINNRVETHIKNGIANFLFENDAGKTARFRVRIDEVQNNQIVFECVGE